MTPTEPIRPPDRGGAVELFTVSLVGTLIVAVAILLRVSWKHLRSRTIEPTDAPIRVE